MRIYIYICMYVLIPSSGMGMTDRSKVLASWLFNWSVGRVHVFFPLVGMYRYIYTGLKYGNIHI